MSNSVRHVFPLGQSPRLLASAGASDPARLKAMMLDFVDQIPALTSVVQAELPKVLTASNRDLDVILGDQWGRADVIGPTETAVAAAIG